jgi:xanthine dehydrogenase accessory factor
MDDWLRALVDLTERGVPHVLITQAEALGSTPRAIGTKMVVTQDHLFGTIGGGQLEFQACQKARIMLSEGYQESKIDRTLLGPDRQQCCGGAVILLFEPFFPPSLSLVLFGAGHVAKALVHVLAEIPMALLWIEERLAMFPDSKPPNSKCIQTESPLSIVQEIPPQSQVLVMTHSHDRDFELIVALLKRNDLKSIGLIGSKTKWARFKSRLKKLGFTPDQFNQIKCPIGIEGISGKRPAEIAISVAAEILKNADPLLKSDIHAK